MGGIMNGVVYLYMYIPYGESKLYEDLRLGHGAAQRARWENGSPKKKGGWEIYTVEKGRVERFSYVCDIQDG